MFTSSPFVKQKVEAQAVTKLAQGHVASSQDVDPGRPGSTLNPRAPGLPSLAPGEPQVSCPLGRAGRLERLQGALSWFQHTLRARALAWPSLGVPSLPASPSLLPCSCSVPASPARLSRPPGHLTTRLKELLSSCTRRLGQTRFSLWGHAPPVRPIPQLLRGAGVSSVQAPCRLWGQSSE